MSQMPAHIEILRTVVSILVCLSALAAGFMFNLAGQKLTGHALILIAGPVLIWVATPIPYVAAVAVVVFIIATHELAQWMGRTQSA